MNCGALCGKWGSATPCGVLCGKDGSVLSGKGGNVLCGKKSNVLCGKGSSVLCYTVCYAGNIAAHDALHAGVPVHTEGIRKGEERAITR